MLVKEIEILSDHITSYTLDTKARWPFVTLPDFEQRISPIQGSDSPVIDFIAFLPLVETMERESWEAYASEHQGWIEDSYLALQKKNSDGVALYQTSNDSFSYHVDQYSISPYISTSINGEKVIHQGVGPYAPVWQLSPPPTIDDISIINQDLLTSPMFGPVLQGMLKRQQQKGKSNSAISDFMELDQYKKHHKNQNSGATPMKANNTLVDTGGDVQPGSAIFQPIYKTYGGYGPNIINSEIVNSTSIKGFAMGVFSWQQYFSGILPEGTNGVFCVLKSTCGQQESHTFRIGGRHAAYIGIGALHDRQFDELSVTTHMNHFHSTSPSPSSTVKKEIDRDTSTCSYTVSIYPSEEFRSSFESNRTAVFTSVIGAVFLATGFVFFLYVSIIGNRQNKVMEIAMGTSAIVASLFPSTVRERIIKDAEQEVRRRTSVQESERGGSAHGSIINKARRKASSQKIQEQRQKHEEQQQQHRGKPIADLFPEATGKYTYPYLVPPPGRQRFERLTDVSSISLLKVLFADIVGFTAWSSIREPTQESPHFFPICVVAHQQILTFFCVLHEFTGV